MREVEVEEPKDLIEYKQYLKVSAYAWNILSGMDENSLDLLGKPFIKSIDIIGACISKAFYFSDNLKKDEYYNEALASLSEATNHWLNLIKRKNLVSKTTYNGMIDLSSKLKAKMESRIDKRN
jgi:hypothetical protein